MEYNKTLFHSNSLKIWAKKYADALPNDVTVLVSMGSSGCAIASAILMRKKKLRHFYIKKYGEAGISHSNHSDCFPREKDIVCFVDDFISSGDTLERAREFLSRYPRGSSIKYALVAYGEGIRSKYPEIKIITLTHKGE